MTTYSGPATLILAGVSLVLCSVIGLLAVPSMPASGQERAARAGQQAGEAAPRWPDGRVNLGSSPDRRGYWEIRPGLGGFPRPADVPATPPYLAHELAGLHRADGVAGLDRLQVPVGVGLDRGHKVVGDADADVGVGDAAHRPLAVDKGQHVGMPDVHNQHQRPPPAAPLLDQAGHKAVQLAPGDRPGGPRFSSGGPLSALRWFAHATSELVTFLDDVPGKHDQGGWAQARLGREGEPWSWRRLSCGAAFARR